jgi:AmmeMemoRadiSam system protein A
MNKQEQDQLMKLARETLNNHFILKNTIGQNTATPGVAAPVGLNQIGASFVTLTKNGQLRGCVGNLDAFEPLYKNVERNILSAAFSDNRFSPVRESELDDIKVEISVLSKPESIQFADSKALLDQIRPKIDGIVLSADGRSATFLPQVWAELPQKELFLSALCQKAGLPDNRWQSPGVEIQKYQVENFSE